MTCIGARRSSKYSQIGTPTAELAAFERLTKSPQTYNGRNGVVTISRLFLIGSISYLQVTMTYMGAWMSLKFGQIRLLVPMTTDSSCSLLFYFYNGKYGAATFSRLFYPIILILAGNDDTHNSSEEFEFLPDPTTDCGVSCPWASEKIPIDL